jgi:hypothetical protein
VGGSDRLAVCHLDGDGVGGWYLVKQRRGVGDKVSIATRIQYCDGWGMVKRSRLELLLLLLPLFLCFLFLWLLVEVMSVFVMWVEFDLIIQSFRT